MTIEQNLLEINKRVSQACERAGRSQDDVTLIAISKTVTAAAIETAYKAGIRNFGESRVQDAPSKIEQLEHIRDDITWHMIGHLQTNKAKTAVNIFDIIHSVDSLKLAATLNEHSYNKLPILIQINAGGELSKSGFALHGTEKALKEVGELPNLQIEGLMTIAPWVDDPEEVRPVFRQLRQMRDALGLRHLSMGMTDDFEVAIEEGATLVRVGRAIFGERKT